MKLKLSTLWIFVMFNYVYGDIFTLMNPEELTSILAGKAGAIQITPEFLLGGAVFIETAILMIVLCRVLKYRANRWANIIVGLLHMASVVSSLFMGTTPTPSYLFCGAMEMACLSFIVWSSWKWANPQTI